MTNPNGWPGEPGVPLIPERTWVHVLDYAGDEWLSAWHAKDEVWDFGLSGTLMTAHEFACLCADEGARYLGPCLTPVEVAAHVEAAEAAWKTAVAEHLRNEEWMRGLLERIGNLFGAAARTSDDGTVHDSVLLLRVPELVEHLVAEVEAKVKAARQKAEIVSFAAGARSMRSAMERSALQAAQAEEERIRALKGDAT
jgi:hypothetical protein